MKDALVAKVAAQASDFYQEAVRSASNHEVKGLWEKVTVLYLLLFNLCCFIYENKMRFSFEK